MRWEMVGWNYADLRMEHVGCLIGLWRGDGDYLNGFSLALCAHSYVDWTCTALQMLPYLVVLPRSSFHFLHVNLLLLSYGLSNTLFLSLLPLILQCYFLSLRVTSLIRLLLIP